MKKTSKNPATMDEFFAGYPPEVRVILEKIRGIIRQVAPQAQEAIKYGIPTFVLEGNLVHFSAYKTHIGFYPDPRGIQAFEKELAPYRAGKGTIQFPLDQPIPYDLIRRVVIHRVNENLALAEARRKKK